MYRSAIINGKTVEYKKAYIEGAEKTTILVNGLEVSSSKEFPNGNFDRKSRTILKDGELAFGLPIKLSEDFRNFTARRQEYNVEEHIFTDTEFYPLIDTKGEVCGEGKSVTTEDLEKGEKKIVETKEIDNGDGIFKISSSIDGIGDEIKNEDITMRVQNKTSGQREDIRYSKNNIGSETYTYMKNGILQQRVTKTTRGTTIDLFDEKGQPTDTYEYDEDGQALIPIENLQQLPDDYVKNCLISVIPKCTPVIEQYASEITEIEEIVENEASQEKNTEEFDR